jgi:hypothetical protein
VQTLLQCKNNIYYTFHAFVTLVIQHEMRKRLIVICGLSGSTDFPTLYHKRQDFQESVIEKLCVLIFSATFVCNTSHSKKN